MLMFHGIAVLGPKGYTPHAFNPAMIFAGITACSQASAKSLLKLILVTALLGLD